MASSDSFLFPLSLILSLVLAAIVLLLLSSIKKPEGGMIIRRSAGKRATMQEGGPLGSHCVCMCVCVIRIRHAPSFLSRFNHLERLGRNGAGHRTIK